MLILLAAPALAAQSFLEATFLDPADHASPSGEYVLHLDPSAPDGAGSARYRLSRDGEALWSREFPFTLRELAVTDAGSTVGYGFSSGDRFGGAFVVAIVAADGEVVLEHRTERTPSGFMHAEPNPVPRGLVLDVEHDRFAVRVADPDLNRGVERWWRFTLSDGRALDELRPLEAMGATSKEHLALLDARAVPGTDLHLLHWWRVDIGGLFQPYLPEGGVFTLMAPDGSVAWRLDLPRDYTIERDEDADDALEERVREHGAIRGVGERGFRLWLVRDSQEATFEVRVAADGAGAWDVAEVARAPYAPPEPAAVASEEPTIELAPIDSRVLESPGGAPNPALRDVRAWSFARGGGFVAVRDERDGGRYTFVHVDADGVVARERPVEGLTTLESGRVTWAHLRDDAWLAIAQDWEASTPPHAHRVDAATGRAEALSGFVAPRSLTVAADFEELAPTPDGGFVALMTFRFKYTQTDALQCFDGDGRRSWVVTQDYQDPTRLFSPADVAVTTDGLVVVVDSITKELRVFDRAGEYVRTIDLATAGGAEPNYPSGLSAAPDGAVLVHDFGGRPSLWHMRPDGTVLRGVEPRFADGREPVELARNARFSPDGELWTFDGYAFVRLDDDGVVVERARDRALPGALHAAATSAIVAGRVCVQDARTGALHVWNEDGALAWIGVAEPSDADLVDSIGRITAGADGSVWVENDRHEYVGWDARGARIGVRSFSHHPAFAPDGRRFWSWGHRTGLTLRAESGELLTTVDRRPDGRWIRGVDDAVVADEHTLAVLDGSDVLLYSADGEPQRTIDALPVGFAQTLDARGDWLLISSWGPAAVLVRRSTGVAQRFIVPGGSDDTVWAHGLSADGRRLLSLCVDGATLTLHRFALP